MTLLPDTSISIIVATDSHNGIGIKNTLPWHLPEDLAHFKQTTLKHPIIMGRKTFDSIGRPLPGRRNIVITRNPEWQHEGVETALSLEEAIDLAQGTHAFIIGGAQIYAQALPLADRLIITRIDKQFDCDAFFPDISPDTWLELVRETHHSDANDFNYAFLTYIRRPAA